MTGILLKWREGDEAALDRLVPIVHDELRRIARRCMAGERAGHSLQATALVNEAYLRLIDVQHVNWQNRAHFLAMSARLMRRILVDYARSKGYQKRGGGAVKVTFDEGLPVAAEPAMDLVALDDALKVLATMDERKSRIIELRFFGGLSVEETATVLDGVARDHHARLEAGEGVADARAAGRGDRLLLQRRVPVEDDRNGWTRSLPQRTRSSESVPSDETAYCALVPAVPELMFGPVASCVLKSATAAPGSSCRSAPTAIGTAIKRPSSPT